jgi:LPS O-antigen subunit length determinant protein (WzzB/FepE family)
MTKVYANKSCTIEDLKEKIHQEIAVISAETLQNVIANLKHRVQLRMDAGGDHFQHLV